MKIKNAYIKFCNWFLSKTCIYKVATMDETIDELLKTDKSLIRFGDGELRILVGKDIGFQKSDKALQKRLAEVLAYRGNEIMIALPGPLGNEYSLLTSKARNWWKDNIYQEKYYWSKYLSKKQKYYNALLSRFYVGIENRTDSERLIKKIKKLWEDKRLLIIEGSLTKNGVGNDLFDNAKEVRRILCPPTNAFDKYDEILHQAISHSKDFDLVLISLGPTSKILAFDLNRTGSRAIDMGHIDNEYEWFVKGDHVRSKLTGKYVNEVEGGNKIEGELDYNSEEILSVIL